MVDCGGDRTRPAAAEHEQLVGGRPAVRGLARGRPRRKKIGMITVHLDLDLDLDLDRVLDRDLDLDLDLDRGGKMRTANQGGV